MGGVLPLLIVIGIAVGGGDSDSESSSPGSANTQANETPPPAPTRSVSFSEAKKAFNGDDAKDLHNRAQQFVNRAEVCLVALRLAMKNTRSAVAMASNLQDARSVCETSKTYLATENAYGFSDQATTLFASADAGKSATGRDSTISTHSLRRSWLTSAATSETQVAITPKAYRT